MIDPGLDGRIVLITGANNPHGIGAATARAFARLGASVFLHGFREPDQCGAPGDEPGEAFHRAARAHGIDEVVAGISRAGGRASGQEADLAEARAISTLFDRAAATFGQVDVLINNAAHGEYDTFAPLGSLVYGVGTEEAVPITPDSHDRTFAVNSRAPALLMAEYARRHLARHASWGRVVNISTDASAAHAGAVSYGASKHALESYSRAAACELGRFGVTVNVVAPGPVQTGWMSPALEARVIAAIPLGRVGSPDDVADVVVFLASEQARWVTGQTLYVGGGHVMPL